MPRPLSILAASSLCLLLLGGCRATKPQEEQKPRTARDATVYSTIVARALAATAPATRPGAPLGVHVGMYLSTVEIPVRGALNGIAGIAPLARSSASVAAPFATIETLGALIQTNVIAMMNDAPDRVGALNSHVALLRQALQDAQRDKGDIEEKLHQLREQERDQRNAVRTLQKEIDAAEKAGDFTSVGSRQRTLSSAKGEHGQTEASLEELDATTKIIDDLAHLADERLRAIEQNREALMSGIRVVEIPGIEALGILEKRAKSRRSPAQWGWE